MSGISSIKYFPHRMYHRNQPQVHWKGGGGVIYAYIFSKWSITGHGNKKIGITVSRIVFFNYTSLQYIGSVPSPCATPSQTPISSKAKKFHPILMKQYENVDKLF